MTIRNSTEADIELCRKMCFAFAWVQAAMGLFLLWQTVTPLVHGVLAALAVAVLLLMGKKEDSRACRVIARVIVGLLMAVMALTLAEAAMALRMGAGQLVYEMGIACAIGVPMGLYFQIGAVRMTFRRGRYDRVIACVYQVWLLAMTLVATRTDCRYAIVWMWDHDTVRLVWLGTVAVATVLTFLYAFQRPAKPEKATPADEAAEAIEEAAEEA